MPIAAVVAAGIRHRRNAASQRVFGETGHVVVSAFEHFDNPPATYCGKDAVLLAAQKRQQQDACAAAGSSSSKQSKRQQAASASSQFGVLQQLQRQLRKHLATQVGLGSVYNKAAERFSSEALATAWQTLQADITQQLQLQQCPAAGVAQQPDASVMQQLTLQHSMQQQPQQQHHHHHDHQQQQVVQPELRLSLSEPAQIACLSQLLPDCTAALELTGEQQQIHHPACMG